MSELENNGDAPDAVPQDERRMLALELACDVARANKAQFERIRAGNVIEMARKFEAYLKEGGDEVVES